MNEELFDWFVNTINYLIFVYIFLKTIGSACFNSSDLTITLIGISSSVLLLIIKILNKRGK